jgi:hypothetical protein
MSCWKRGCKEEEVMGSRNLHLVGYQDTYKEDDHDTVELRKKVWAPCGNWVWACSLHPLPEAIFFDIGELCPHGSTPKERGVPVPNFPLVGKTAIVLETDF